MNERNAGRKPEGETAKVHRTHRLPPFLIDKILNEFESYSFGIECIVRDYYGESFEYPPEQCNE